MFELPEIVIKDAEKFKESLGKYLLGEIKDTFFRGIRVPWGNYSQRGGKVLMSRLRIPSGILTPKQLKAIGEAAGTFAASKLHITTRQDIQIHDVSYENTIKIIEYLKDYNISPRGGGGNTVRNITSCYLSGVCPQENIETYKLAWELTEYLLSLEEALNLPRKLKIAFSGCREDCACTGVNDIGFVAVNGGFKLICGGGMGAKSAVGKTLRENVKPEEIGRSVKSLINIFNKYGDRKNKSRNRLRFLIQDIGWDKFVGLYNQELDKVKQAEYIVLRTDAGLPELPACNSESHPAAPEQGKDYQLFLKYSVGRQKQEGYYYVRLRIPFGEVDSGALISLSELEAVIPTIIFRTTQRQNLIISNVPQDKLVFVYEKVKVLLKDFLLPETILDLVSCKAVTTCNLGICNAIGLAPEIVRELEKTRPDLDKLKEVKIHINGCPNACGQHPIGTISLSGLARKFYGRSVPFYKIYLGGKIDAENTVFAEEIGVVPARVVPKLIPEFVLGLQNDSTDRKQLMTELIKKYAYVPPYEEDQSYYYDFGRTEEFSLDGLSQGECGSGVIDMIESDLESARQSLAKAKEGNLDLSEIKKALLYSSRALLVVKGVDPKDEKDIIPAFVDKFILTGVCGQEFKNINSVHAGLLSGNIAKPEAHDFAQKFYREIKEIYSSMDGNFNFKIRLKEAQPEQQIIRKEREPVLYDLRGVSCPINYVKTKIKLEELNVGELLEVYLDEGEPIANVPRSLQNDGQEILKIEPVNNYFKIVIKKKVT